MLNSSAAHNPCAELMRASNYGSGGGLGLILRSGLEIFVVDLIFPRLCIRRKFQKNKTLGFGRIETALLLDLICSSLDLIADATALSRRVCRRGLSRKNC